MIYKYYIIDESKFVKINGVPLSVIGKINTVEKTIRPLEGGEKTAALGVKPRQFVKEYDTFFA